MARRRQPRIDGDIQDIIDELALKRWGPSQIHKRLQLLEDQGKLPLSPRGETRIPDVRTVQRRVKDLTPRDPLVPWRWWEDDPDDARLALDVLAEVIVRTEGRVTQFTQREAAWISRLCRMLPDVPPWAIYMLARGYYMVVEDEGPQYLAPEDLLFFTPWRSREHEQRWLRLLKLREDKKALPERPWAIRLPLGPAQKEEGNGKPTRKQ